MKKPSGRRDAPDRSDRAQADAQSRGGREAAAFATSGGSSLAEGAGLHRLLVESVQDYAIFALDTDGNILSWNRGAERFKGYSENEILGKHYSIFYTEEGIAEERPQKLLRIAREKGHVEDEGWRVRKDGTRFWANVTITALRDETGTLVGYAKITRDLTDRRLAEQALFESEERFRLLVTSVQDYGIFMLDPQGRIASWNEGAQRINGYTADEVIGKHFSIFYPEVDIAAEKPERELEIVEREGRLEDEDWRVRKDGSRFWANVIITALRDPEGKLVGFAKVTRDLSERKAAEQRAVEDARRVAQAEASSRAKTEFLAAMSHELRTPLNAIGGYAELMDVGVAGPLSEQQREYLARIQSSQRHLLAIINDLLNYIRVEAGQVNYDIEPVNLRGVIDAVHDMVAPQALRRNIRLDRQLPTGEVVASGDRLKIEQIVLNLLSNAVKFTPEGGHVRVSYDRAGSQTEIRVTDNGPGIPSDKLGEIFEPFVQLGRSLSTIREGTGLGLAISRDLARAMKGEITVDSEVGKGSTFILKLPAA